MEAMIFAAGLGTRLGDLTDNKPKALVELEGKPLLQHTIERLYKYGIRHIVVNAHHHGQQIQEFIASYNLPSLRLQVSFEKELLNTGGGLFFAKKYFNLNNPILVTNVDLLSNLDLEKIHKHFEKMAPMALLVVRERDTARYLMFDGKMRLSGWTNIETKEVRKARDTDADNLFAFSGIQIVDPKIFTFPPEGKKVFSMIDWYLELAKEHEVLGYKDDTSLWMDLGRKEDLLKASEQKDQESQ